MGNGDEVHRKRRTAAEIKRDHICTVFGCGKAYGSEGALRMHKKLKHLEGSPGSSEAETNSKEPLQASRNTPFLKSTNVLKVSSKAKSTASGNDRKAPMAPLLPKGESSFSSQSGPQWIKEETQSLKSICNVPVLMLKIGNWQKFSSFCGDILAKFSFTDRLFAWEIYSTTSLVFKIEFQFDNVAGMGLDLLADGSCVLSIQLHYPPQFANARFQSHKSLVWQKCGDFTSSNASTYQCHMLHFPRGSLSVPLEALLQGEPRLRQLAQKGLNITTDPIFPSQIPSVTPFEMPYVHYQSPLPYPSFDDKRLPSSAVKRPLPLEMPSIPSSKPSAIPQGEKPNDKKEKTKGLISSDNLSDCARANVEWVLQLSPAILSNPIELPCCFDTPTLKDLLEEYRCKCNKLLTYSFCQHSVVPKDQVWHCKECGVCRDRKEWHCNVCNKCSNGIGFPCQHCSRPESTECKIQ